MLSSGASGCGRENETETRMGEKGIIEYGVFDAEEHPESGQFQWVWTSPGGAEYRGPQFHDSEADALKAGREWLRQQEIEQG
jgi:hypothetical protein